LTESIYETSVWKYVQCRTHFVNTLTHTKKQQHISELYDTIV